MSFLHVTTKILLVLSILLVFASCEKEEVINKQNSDNELIVGYWLLSKGETFATNSKGEKIVTATLNPKIFAHEFLADGTYINHNLTSTSSTERGTWKVEVKKKMKRISKKAFFLLPHQVRWLIKECYFLTMTVV
ncbi:MAG: hypothetical protein IPF52_16080 [Saprospiraceae bacterium]|nr:hypothetical protein [Saprospiraceae bacterium]